MHESLITKKLELLRGRTVVGRTPVGPWAVRVTRYEQPGQYTVLRDWEPLAAGATFEALETVFLRARVTVPATAAPGCRRFLDLHGHGLEGLLSVDTRPYAGLDWGHGRVAAPAAGEHELLIEAMCHLDAYHRPEMRTARAGFDGLSLVEVDTEIEGALYDLLFTWETVRVVRDARRRALLDAALEEALLQIDLTRPLPEFRAEVGRAREVLRERLAQIAPDPEGGRIFLVGHTHIDTAWLWPVAETVRKCARTFSTAVRLLEQYPGFEFACSQAQLFAFTKQYYPELYADIRKWVREGRFHTTGAMWVEADCNVPSGEALIRQVLYGLRFFREEFGTRPRVCWLPDVFGYPGNLPQLLKGAGIDSFMTCKLHWQSLNPIPSQLFWWEGIDGSRVLAHIPRLRSYYNGFPRPEELAVAWDNCQPKAEPGEVLFPYGFGDGGGGVNIEMLEYAARAGAFPGLPATRTGHEETFFAEAARAGDRLPVWSGELYLETHRGTYTSQSRTKQANRRTEELLREAEVWSSLAAIGGAAVDDAPLRRAWERLLLQQFHDILPGSSIGPVYVDAQADLAQARQEAEGVRTPALAAVLAAAGLAGDLCVANARSWDRTDPLAADLPAGLLPAAGPLHLADALGRTTPLQIVAATPATVSVVCEPPAVPALGARALYLRPGDVPPIGELTATEQAMENDYFRLEFDADGGIVRLLDKRIGRELVPAGEVANDWQFFQDGPERESAWNVHATFDKRRYPPTAPAVLRVTESGPVRATLRIERRFRDSTLACDVSLYRRTPRLDFRAEVDWQERQVLLKVAFPVAVRSSQATYEIQYGAIERPTHCNTTWESQKFEVAAHRWADLSEAGYGVSLLNDGRYGYDVKGHVLRLTLLRGPEYPDPEADRGRHTFTYSLFPHLGDWRLGGTVRRAAELNTPLTVVPRSGPAPQAAAGEGAAWHFGVWGEGLFAETLKRADDGDGWILRVYEAHGGRGLGTCWFGTPPRRVTACNLVEEPGEELELHGSVFRFPYAPYQIQSFRLRF